MALAAHALIHDTNIPGKLNSPLYNGGRDRIVSTMSQNFRVAVSPETLIELLNTLQGGFAVKSG